MRARIEHISDTHEAHVYEENLDDIRAVADWCKAIEDSGQNKVGELRMLAVIPDILIQQYRNDHQVSYAEFIRNPEHANRMLNDPALAGFRTHRGRV